MSSRIGAQRDENRLRATQSAFRRGSYYGARYEDASRCFEKAWSLPGPWASWAALGLCKVASDLGHWALARDWGLVALHLAREENDFERHSEAAGALGEVFLRAGQPKLAYELVSLDAALLPPGSGYRDRLTNYLAVCLGRLGEYSLAEPLLWHGFFAAREHDPVSAAYSRASLYVLSALIPNRSLFCRLEAGISHSVASGAELPEAIVECVRAYWGAAGTSGPSSGFERSEVLAHLERARAMLGPFYPVERAWVRELVCHVAGEPYDEAELESLRQRRSPAPPPPLRHLLDAHLADADLSTPLPFPLLGGGRVVDRRDP